MHEFSCLTDGLRFPEGPIAMPDGAVILVEIGAGCLTRVDKSGSVSRIATLGGGPNGAAIGPDGDVYVCNNGGFRWHLDNFGMRPLGPAEDHNGGKIQRIDLSTGNVRTLYDRSDNGPLQAPNDLVFDRTGGFWFTDSAVMGHRQMNRGSVYYAQPDGSSIHEAIFPMLQPNGIGLSPDEETLYVAETVSGRLWAFDVERPGQILRREWPSPNGGRVIARMPGYRLLDSLAIEAGGNVAVATLYVGGVIVISPDGNVVEDTTFPDRFVTNVCFGGSGRRTAYVTLSQSGRLVALNWARPGLKLNFDPAQ
jgi:gluconolactonase